MELTGKYKMENQKSKMEVNMINPGSLTHSQIPEQRATSVANMSRMTPPLWKLSRSLVVINMVAKVMITTINTIIY